MFETLHQLYWYECQKVDSHGSSSTGCPSTELRLPHGCLMALCMTIWARVSVEWVTCIPLQPAHGQLRVKKLALLHSNPMRMLSLGQTVTSQYGWTLCHACPQQLFVRRTTFAVVQGICCETLRFPCQRIVRGTTPCRGNNNGHNQT